MDDPVIALNPDCESTTVPSMSNKFKFTIKFNDKLQTLLA